MYEQEKMFPVLKKYPKEHGIEYEIDYLLEHFSE